MIDDPAGTRPRMKPRLRILRPTAMIVPASCVSLTPGSPGSAGIPSTAVPATLVDGKAYDYVATASRGESE